MSETPQTPRSASAAFPLEAVLDGRSDEAAQAAGATGSPVVADPADRLMVTAILIAHDGARWLPQCLDGLAAQTCPPQRVVAVDTGSTDGSAALLTDRLGESAVLRLPRDTALGAAVDAGIAAFTAAPASAGGGTSATEWLWLVHDDCAPDPEALAALLARADGSPSTWVVGPKVRDWDGARLVELGSTVDRVGHRETWLDGRELDQGQADHRTEALAAGTAGLLVRREAWERLGGLDPLGWPFADDVDLGWQVRAAGGQVALAPAATVRHAAAARLPDGVHRRPAVRRNRSMRVVLANTSGPMAMLLWVRIVLGALPRALGWLLARRGTTARDELLAAAGVISAAGQIRAARRVRKSRRTVPPRDVRRSLAGVDDRLRRVVDMMRGSASPSRRRNASAETGPVDESVESLHVDDAATLRRFLTRPGVAVVVAMAILAVIADRGLFSAHLAGGRLLPSPAGASDLWGGYLAAWHPAGVGTAASSPPGVAVLALLATILLGHAPLAIALVMLAGVPLSALTAWHASRMITEQTAPRLWAAVAWGVLPSVTGAVAGGRIDVCVAAILLPVLARVMVTALRGGRPSAGAEGGPSGGAGGWSRCIGAGLLLGVVTGFTPVVWPLVVIAALVTIATSGGRGLPRRLGGLALMAAVGFAVCLPWSLWLVRHPADIVAGMGLPDLVSTTPLLTGQVLLLHPGGPAQPPLWTTAALLLAAAAGLFRSSRAVRGAWLLLVVGLAGALVVSRVDGIVTGEPASRAWPAVPMLLAAAGALAAGLAAAHRAPQSLSRRAFGIAQPVAAVVAGVAVVAVGWNAVGWAVRGAGRPLAAGPQGAAPIFVADALAGPTSPRALILRGRDPMRIALARDPSGLHLGSGVEAAASTTSTQDIARRTLQRAVTDLLAGRRTAPAELSAFGVGYLVAERGATRAVVGGASAIGGFDVTRTSGVTVLRSPAPAGELMVTGPGATSAGSPGVTTLPASANGTANTRLGPAGAPRRLLLAEPADAHWQATLGGRRLAPGRSGWQQTFLVPAGRSGRLQVRYAAPGRTAWLIGQLVTLVVCCLLALPFYRLDRDDGEPASVAAAERQPAEATA